LNADNHKERTRVSRKRPQRDRKIPPPERAYTVDEVNGKITFGNGTKGMVPPAGSSINSSCSKNKNTENMCSEDAPCMSYPTFKRNNYFYGKLLTVEDFRQEQEYFINKQRLANRLILGKGIVCGFAVTKGSTGSIEVSEGLAIDGCGREIILNTKYTCDLNQKYTINDVGGKNNLFVTARYNETKVDPVTSSGAGSEFNMILEGAKIEVDLIPPDPSSTDDIFLAKVNIKTTRKKILVKKIEDLTVVNGRTLSRIVVGRKESCDKKWRNCEN
jgi:hypothetical protein